MHLPVLFIFANLYLIQVACFSLGDPSVRLISVPELNLNLILYQFKTRIKGLEINIEQSRRQAEGYGFFEIHPGRTAQQPDRPGPPASQYWPGSGFPETFARCVASIKNDEARTALSLNLHFVNRRVIQFLLRPPRRAFVRDTGRSIPICSQGHGWLPPVPGRRSRRRPSASGGWGRISGRTRDMAHDGTAPLGNSKSPTVTEKFSWLSCRPAAGMPGRCPARRRR